VKPHAVATPNIAGGLASDYAGRAAELALNGSRFFGIVRSVQEDQSRSPRRWIVTIVPTVEKPPLVGWRYSTRP
jgi:hypothetical protein